MKSYLKIITNYLSADLGYNFLNKEDLESDDFNDKSAQRNFKSENETPNLTILSVLEEEIMHFSVDKFFIRCFNLDLTAKKTDINRKFISFEINKIKLNINTEILGKPYHLESLMYPSKPTKIFHILDISLIFSEITKCIFKNISIDFQKEISKKESLFALTIEKIEIIALKDKNQNFFLCPYSKKKTDILKKKLAFIMELKIFDSKIQTTSIKLLPVSISLSKQKTNAVLQTLNVLMEMNKHEYKLFKNFLKTEVMQNGYKELIKQAKFEIETDQKKDILLNAINKNNFFRNETNELSKISIEFKKIFLILSKNEEVNYYFKIIIVFLLKYLF